ncbi:hypothetical protein BOTBODRAFT_403378 [Botryobasidium botryosum FD-172 SS1]|uniref:Uncharacterized protein n=1 Tax=Botryobasidium botryosum (strain FD-172 SS1) TaxID=930990 RepID=A0A067MLX4_BOTB1|nr:hypothetical protein BOTBODRAFT_403378 [Botryobasidium botryosum FD-172 SS1]
MLSPGQHPSPLPSSIVRLFSPFHHFTVPPFLLPNPSNPYAFPNSLAPSLGPPLSSSVFPPSRPSLLSILVFHLPHSPLLFSPSPCSILPSTSPRSSRSHVITSTPYPHRQRGPRYVYVHPLAASQLPYLRCTRILQRTRSFSKPRLWGYAL